MKRGSERERERKKKGKRPMWVPCGKMENGKAEFLYECSTEASRVTWRWKVVAFGELCSGLTT